MAQLFLSHSSADDGFVRELRDALADLGQPVWIDSRQLKGGDPLWSAIQAAIEAATVVKAIDIVPITPTFVSSEVTRLSCLSCLSDISLTASLIFAKPSFNKPAVLGSIFGNSSKSSKAPS
jgi:hypothetical protein